MAKQKRTQSSFKPKPGSSVKAAREVGGDGDFGVPMHETLERAYVSENTRRSDPGHAVAHSGDTDGGDGARETGAGAPASGPGSSSGGDVDTDIVGVGTNGSGIAASGVTHHQPGPDDSDGTAAEFAGKVLKESTGDAHVIPAKGAHRRDIGKIGSTDRVDGTFVQPPNQDTDPDGAGADNATNRARNDDSFSAEISSGEARGDDTSLGRND